MKRLLSIIMCAIMISALLSACGNSGVTITLNDKYKNPLADELSSSSKKDDSGNTVYTFTKPQYIRYTDELMKKVTSEFKEVLKDTATYSYLIESGTELVVGIEDDAYDEAECRAQAETIGKIALMYNYSTLESTGTVAVTYENCFTGEKYFIKSVSKNADT